MRKKKRKPDGDVLPHPRTVEIVVDEERMRRDADPYTLLSEKIAAPPPTTEHHEEQPATSSQLEQVAQAIGDETAATILTVANRKEWSGERRMKEIIFIDKRFAGKSS